MKRALVIINGNKEGDIEFFQHLLQDIDTLVCADGGAEFAYDLGLIPDKIFGDLDSLLPVIRDHFQKLGIEFVNFPVEKDKTDTQLVLDHLIMEGYDEIILTAALGGRPDHLLGNLMLLSYGFNCETKMKIISPTVEISVISTEAKIEGHKGDTFSLIPIDSYLKGVNLIGFKYPLLNAEVPREGTLAISNVINSDLAVVEIREGKAFMFIINQVFA